MKFTGSINSLTRDYELQENLPTSITIIDDLPIRPKALVELQEFLKKRTCVKIFKFAGARLDGNQIGDLMCALYKHKQLTELHLPHNLMGDHGLELVLKCLPTWPALRVLRVHSNNITHAIFPQIARAVASSLLEHIHVYDAADERRVFQDANTSKFEGPFEGFIRCAHHQLTAVTFAGQFFTEDHDQSTPPTDEDSPTYRHRFSHNPCLSAFLAAMTRCTQLNALTLRACSMPRGFLKEIFFHCALEQLQTLHITSPVAPLELEGLGNVFRSFVVSFKIKSLSGLSDLSLSKCQLGPNDVTILTAFLSYFDKLKFLNLEGNKFGSAVAEQLLACISSKQLLQEVNLADCELRGVDSFVASTVASLPNCTLFKILPSDTEETTRQLREYGRLLDEGAKELDVITINVVGWKEVGKSQLIRALKGLTATATEVMQADVAMSRTRGVEEGIDNLGKPSFSNHLFGGALSEKSEEKYRVQEFAGQVQYLTVHDHFVRSGPAVFIIVVNLAKLCLASAKDPPRAEPVLFDVARFKSQIAFWMSFLTSKLGRVHPPSIVVVGSHADELQFYLKVPQNHTSLKNECQQALLEVFSGFRAGSLRLTSEDVFFLNCRQNLGPELDSLRDCLKADHAKCVGTVKHLFPSFMAFLLHRIKDYRDNAPETPWINFQHFKEYFVQRRQLFTPLRSGSKTFCPKDDLLTDERIRKTMHDLHRLGYLFYSETGPLTDFVFLSFPWLGQKVFAPLVAPLEFFIPSQKSNIEDFRTKCKRGAVNVRQALPSSPADDSKLPLNHVIILRALQACYAFPFIHAPTQDRTLAFERFVFPSLVECERPAALRDFEKTATYTLRIECAEDRTMFLPGIFFRAQCELRNICPPFLKLRTGAIVPAYCWKKGSYLTMRDCDAIVEMEAGEPATNDEGREYSPIEDQCRKILIHLRCPSEASSGFAKTFATLISATLQKVLKDLEGVETVTFLNSEQQAPLRSLALDEAPKPGPYDAFDEETREIVDVQEHFMPSELGAVIALCETETKRRHVGNGCLLRLISPTTGASGEASKDPPSIRVADETETKNGFLLVNSFGINIQSVTLVEVYYNTPKLKQRFDLKPRNRWISGSSDGIFALPVIFSDHWVATPFRSSSHTASDDELRGSAPIPLLASIPCSWIIDQHIPDRRYFPLTTTCVFHPTNPDRRLNSPRLARWGAGSLVASVYDAENPVIVGVIPGGRTSYELIDVEDSNELECKDDPVTPPLVDFGTIRRFLGLDKFALLAVVKYSAL
eukprot:m.819289 g.819289  ORF g.819289 m.819289 type:complete len:1269 (+) comp59389_c0_seq7:1816-5622(+)